MGPGLARHLSSYGVIYWGWGKVGGDHLIIALLYSLLGGQVLSLGWCDRSRCAASVVPWLGWVKSWIFEIFLLFPNFRGS